MSKPIVSGQKHISEKASTKSVKASFAPRTQLDIPEWAKEDAKIRDLELRWVDAKQMAENGNMHKNHWQIYRRDSSKVTPEGDVFGLPPDGTVRRGTVVLAARPKAIADGHREYLKEKANRLTASVKKQGAEIRRMARNAGIEDELTDETEIS